MRSNSPWIGKHVSELKLPPGSTLSLIIRNDQAVVPTPETVIEASDKLIGFTPIASEGQVEEAVRQ